MPNEIDWKKIKAEYVNGNVSYRKLADKYSVSFSTFRRVAEREKWTDLRTQCRQKSDIKIVESVSNSQAQRAKRIYNAADRLLAKIEKAIDELDLAIATNTTKIKEIEYNNEMRPDKPTKEVITETQTVESYQSIVDRAGLKAIASALKDLKDVQNIRTALDDAEQKARIAKLEHDAKDEEQTDNEIKITIEGTDLEKYAK